MLSISQDISNGDKTMVTIDNSKILISPNHTAKAWEIYEDHEALRHICKVINDKHCWVDTAYDMIINGKYNTYNIILLVSCILSLYDNSSNGID